MRANFASLLRFFDRPARVIVNRLKPQLPKSVVAAVLVGQIQLPTSSAQSFPSSTNLPPTPVVTNRPPLLATPFVALPLGSVRPQGWLLKQCQLQRDGLTGNAETIYANDLGTNSAWLGGTGENWERGPYYFKGLVALAYTLNDDGLKQKAQKWMDWLLNHQGPDGYIGPTSNNDWWPRMVATYALKDYYEATADPRVPTVLSNYFHYMLANLPSRPLRDWGKSRAGDEMDVALWLYNRNGDTNLLTLVQLLRQQAYDWPGIFTSNNFALYGTDFQPKHNVNIEQALKMPAVYYQVSQQPGDENSVWLGIDHLMRENALSFGINSGTEFLAGDSSIQGVELCAIVEAMLSLETAARITGDPLLADRLETIAFNALPAALANNIKGIQYYTLANNVIAIPGGHGFNQDYANGTLPGPNSGYPCCRCNFHMGWPKYVENSWAATADGGLALMAYGPTVVNAMAGGQQVQITEDTGYPFAEQVQLSISVSNAAAFPLVLRIPGWCSNATVAVNGQLQSGVQAGSFYRIARTWTNGDSVAITLPMPIQTLTGPSRAVAINRGPVVYSLKIGESWTTNTPDPLGLGFNEYQVHATTPWNYALQLNPQDPAASLVFTNYNSNPTNPFDPSQPSVALLARARQLPDWTIGWRGTHAFEPPVSPVASTNPLEKVTLVPFGSQHMRISWFPYLGTPSPTCGSFSENFDPTWCRRWTTFGGNWLARNGTLSTVPDSANGAKAVAMATAFTNFTYEGDVSVGPVGNAGLIFRVSQPDIGADAYRGYYAGIDAADGELQFGYADNGWHGITNVPMPIAANTFYHLKIQAAGARLRVYVNDTNQPVLDLQDAHFASGMLGVRDYCTDGAQSLSSYAHLTATEDSADPPSWQMKQAPLMTRWAALVDTNAPLPEYPRPQMVRTDWLNLNGLWQFQPGATNDPVPVGQTLSNLILVPYPMESALSGVMQYHEFSWYRRTFTVPAGWSGKEIILHLDAVDWQATVYVNGQQVGVHQGGYDPFSYDITPYLNGGTNELIVQVYSPEDNGSEPRGKQTLYPGGIMYTSSSGIWQPVWLEPVDAAGISSLHLVPDVDNSLLRLTVNTYATNGVTVVAAVSSNGVPLSTGVGRPQTELDIPVPNPNLWSPENPFLYDLQVWTIHNGVTNDYVTSYFGMRKISVKVINGVPKILLNNQPYFEIGPLDQGFWPDGIYTAPTDDALKYDLQEEKALGFNAVRKHIKVERQRWYYWADKLGLLVWQDMPSCNSYTGNPNPPPIDARQFIAELSAMVTNHWNSPAIIMWDIFNEGQGQAGSGNGVGQTNTAYLVNLVKTLDPSRLVNEASGGNYFGAGDVLDAHSYPNPGNPTSATQAPVDGEFGGIAWHVAGHLWNPAQAGNGYLPASSLDNFADLYDGYINEAVSYKAAVNGGLNAAIYTQITDVENECNGLMTYDRLIKPDPGKILISNQKAITGRFNVTTIVPTSQGVSQTWQYTTNAVPANWYASNFNASAWSTGAAGFGTVDPNVTPRTAWTTPGYIYLRRAFNPGALTAQQISNLVFKVYHDEDVVIYLNGVLAGSASGYSTAYVSLAMTPQAKAALVPNATNVLAVSCHQTIGGQFIDVGIADETLLADTLTAPTDYLGYWPLDATNGTIAADASGHGNNGTVVDAVWSPDGKINGCLNFDGLDDYVQINNLVSNDFSISFWVKTTQSGGIGQWYQGRCLVDGYVGNNADDFGTSLAGNNFAFGAGNPDTTIVSTTAINDGLWHQCVATREQATGTLKIYVDGALQATGVGGTNSLTAPSCLRFGSRQTGVNFFGGSLDDIRIYNRVLGGNEIAALYLNSAFPPDAPSNLTATAGNAQVALSWFESLPATSYVVSRSTASGGPYTVIGSTTATDFLDTNVVNGTTYYYVVRSANLAGAGASSAEVSATPFNLAAWFKADAIAGLADGAAVSTWPDASGNSNDATQMNASQQPVYVTGAMNGLPVVRFNSTNGTFLAFPRPVQDDFTMFIVFQSRQNNQGTGTAFYQGAGLVNGDQPNVQNDFGTALNANGQLIGGTGNPDTSIVSGGGFNDGRPHLLTFERTESAGAIALYVDGTLAASGNGGANSLTAPATLDLGAVPSGGGFFNGDIAEVKIFNSALADSDRIHQENLLLYKWGVRALPTLALTNVNVGAGSLSITWPASANGWTLYFATNLLPPVLWWPVTNVVGSNAGRFSVSVPLRLGAQFFRLSGS